MSTTKGQLVAAIAEFINSKIDANEALFHGGDADVERSGKRSIRAAEKLAELLELFVDERIKEVTSKK